LNVQLKRLVVLVAGCAALTGCSWFQNIGGKDNVDPPAELTDFQASLDVSRLWSRGVGDGAGRAGLRLRPVIAGSVVYVSDIDGGVSALDADDGRVIWRAEIAERAASGVGVGDDLVVVGTLDGRVVALGRDDGAPRWSAAVSSEVIARPVVDAGIVVARVNDGRVYGFDAASGERRWVFDRGVPLLSLRGNGAPVVAGSAVYVGYDNGKVVALNLIDGGLRWEQTLAQVEGRTELERMVDVDGELAFADSQLYAVSYRGQVGSLTLDQGRPLWSRDMSSYGGVALDGDRLYVSDAQGSVWALDAASGASLWKQEGLANRWVTTPVVVGDAIAVADFEGYLHFLSRDDGSFVARVEAGGAPIRATPLASGNLIVTVDSEGKVAAFRVGAG
jgi:outer membrane protein assembly factor BamB